MSEPSPSSILPGAPEYGSQYTYSQASFPSGNLPSRRLPPLNKTAIWKQSKSGQEKPGKEKSIEKSQMMNMETEGDGGQQSDDTLDGSVVRQRKRHRSFTEKRRNSMNLTPLVMPGNEYSGFSFPPHFGKKEDIKEESKELFEHFVYDEISREHLQVPDDLMSSTLISTPQGYKNPTWAKYGRELRVMADEFAQTKERQRIKNRAGGVNMDSATYESFSDMLSELFFSGGMSSAITRPSDENIWTPLYQYINGGCSVYFCLHHWKDDHPQEFWIDNTIMKVKLHINFTI
ncbi:uncharacterized protein [Argopecten irradians]|uniref:uncharacterized protein isoform X2 n=1 Tax=Argopecten irradians TaxID=31199 RepID=UPI00371A68DF